MSPVLRRRSQPPLRPTVPLDLLEVLREGPAPLVPGRDADGPLRIVVVIPQFRRGSGGHSTIANLVRSLEARGHVVRLLLRDEEGRHAGQGADEVDRLFQDFFGPLRGGVGRLEDGVPDGADVAVATGWQTVPAVLRISARARAYLVQDDEPQFYATSAERQWAEWSYHQDLHCVCASPWLADTIAARTGAETSSFDLGVDHSTYTPLPTHRRDDLVLFYARAITPRRAVPLGLLALTELHRRRSEVEIALFGEPSAIETPFPHRDLGVLEGERLAHAYASAAVGVVLSLTNPSLVPAEMLACGLPVVDVASEAMVRTFGTDGPVELAGPDPLELCAAIERLLDDLALRADRSRQGMELVARRTWDRAAEQVEEGLRRALEDAQRPPRTVA